MASSNAGNTFNHELRSGYVGALSLALQYLSCCAQECGFSSMTSETQWNSALAPTVARFSLGKGCEQRVLSVWAIQLRSRLA
eukprot:6202056-Pleurochrysis_carterae.AAC.2